MAMGQMTLLGQSTRDGLDLAGGSIFTVPLVDLIPALVPFSPILLVIVAVIMWQLRPRKPVPLDVALPESETMSYFRTYPFGAFGGSVSKVVERGEVDGVEWVTLIYGGPKRGASGRKRAPVLLVKAGPVIPMVQVVPRHPVIMLDYGVARKWKSTRGTALHKRFWARSEKVEALKAIPAVAVDQIPGVRDFVVTTFFEYGVVGVIGYMSGEWFDDAADREAMVRRLTAVGNALHPQPVVGWSTTPVTLDAYFSRDPWPGVR